MSLKRKFQYVYTISSAVIAAALVLGILLSVKGMDMLTNTLDNNEKAIELYRAVTKEHNTLKLYSRMHRQYCLNRLMKSGMIQKGF